MPLVLKNRFTHTQSEQYQTQRCIVSQYSNILYNAYTLSPGDCVTWRHAAYRRHDLWKFELRSNRQPMDCSVWNQVNMKANEKAVTYRCWTMRTHSVFLKAISKGAFSKRNVNGIFFVNIRVRNLNVNIIWLLFSAIFFYLSPFLQKWWVEVSLYW
jgi:hypothetical protein